MQRDAEDRQTLADEKYLTPPHRAHGCLGGKGSPMREISFRTVSYQTGHALMCFHVTALIEPIASLTSEFRAIGGGLGSLESAGSLGPVRAALLLVWR
jgi:hypothetical protein